MENFFLGKPYGSREEALKARHGVFTWLCFIAIAQAVFAIIFWWINTSGENFQIPTTNGYEILFLAIALYFINSRAVAWLFVSLSSFSFLAAWIYGITQLGRYSPPGMALFILVAAVQTAITVYKTREWEMRTKEGLPRSRAVELELLGTFFITSLALVIPAAHFWHYSHQIELIDMGTTIAYHDPVDDYGFDFPKSWLVSHPFPKYGTVTLVPTYTSATTTTVVTIERWSPASVAAVTLFDKDTFLSNVLGEAEQYTLSSGATVETVELVGPRDSTINAARALLLNKDGSKRYWYYYYDRAWNRDTSPEAWFFWRVTADIPKDAANDEAEFLGLVHTFRIDGFTVDSQDKTNIDETRESFSYFLAAASASTSDLRAKIETEVPTILDAATPDKSILFEARADVTTYTEKVPSDEQVNSWARQLSQKLGKCWGLPRGSCE